MSLEEDDYKGNPSVGLTYALLGYDAARLHALAHEFAHVFTYHVNVLCRGDDECVHEHPDFRQKEEEFGLKVLEDYFKALEDYLKENGD